MAIAIRIPLIEHFRIGDVNGIVGERLGLILVIKRCSRSKSVYTVKIYDTSRRCCPKTKTTWFQ